MNPNAKKKHDFVVRFSTSDTSSGMNLLVILCFDKMNKCFIIVYNMKNFTCKHWVHFVSCFKVNLKFD